MEFFWTKSHVAIVVVGTQAKYISLWMVENKNILFMLNLLCRECHHVFVVCCKVPYISQSWFKTRNMKMFSTIRLVTQLRQWYINRVLPWNDDHGCWAASRLFRHQESPGRAFHGDVNGLDIGGQHGRRSVLLRHTRKPQRRSYLICASRSGIVRHRCGGGLTKIMLLLAGSFQ